MTAGERSGRGYGPDEQSFPPYHAGSPHDTGGARPAADGQPPGWYDEPAAEPHGASQWPADGQWPADRRWPADPAWPRGGPAGHPAPGEGDPDGYQPSGGYPAGYPADGYPAGGYAGDGYPGEGYPGGGYQGDGYQGDGYQGDGYPGDGYQAGGGHGEPPPYQGYPPPAGHDYPTETYRAVGHAGRSTDPPPPAWAATGDPWADPGYGQPRHEGFAAGGYAGERAATGRRPTRRGAGDGDADPRRAKRRGLPLWQELPLLLVIAFCLAILVRTFLLQAFYIPSGSMEDTLIAGDRVLVNKVVYNFRDPARGEVVVFEGTDAWAPVGTDDEDIGTLAKVGRTLGDLVGISRPGASDYIKRVVGLPGDTVSCCDVEGRVFVNGQPLNEDYVIRNSPLDDVPPGDCRSRRFDEVVVQPGQMFVMGDHRQVSQDSRCQGQVPIDNVIGRAFVVVWPSDRWSALSQPETFALLSLPTEQGTLPAGAQTVLVLPLLLSLGATLRGDSPASPLAGRRRGRRLA